MNRVPAWFWWALGASGMLTFRGVLQKKAALSWDVGRIGMVAAAVSVLVWWIVDVLDVSERKPFTREALVWTIVVGVISTLGAVCSLYALRRGPAAGVGAVNSSYIVFTVGLAWLMLGETVTPAQFCGILLVVAGLVLLSR